MFHTAGQTLFGQAIVVAMAAGSFLVFVGTKGQHPGWIGLLGVAVLAWLASSAPS